MSPIKINPSRDLHTNKYIIIKEELLGELIQLKRKNQYFSHN